MRREEVGRRPECPEPGRWSAPDGFSSETETSAFLGALVAYVKPDVVIETGSYLGDTTAAIGRALQALGRGHCTSLELDPIRAEAAEKRCAGLPVTVVAGPSADYTPSGLIDLLFLDSEWDTRVPELLRFQQWASPRCVIAVHDTGNLDFPAARRMVQGLERAAVDGITTPWVYLPTPRGLGLSRYRR